MPTRSRHLIIGAVAAAALVLVCAFLHEHSDGIPPDYQFQSQFSRPEAELFYAKARQQLRQNYWNGIYGNLRNRQFRHAWERFKNGQGHIEGALTNNNADVLACVRFRNGEGYWITVEGGGH